MKRVGIYARASTKELARNPEGTIKCQIERLKYKLEDKNRTQKNWGKLVQIYKDEGWSGKNTDRPAFQRMLADVQAKRIDTIMVTEFSRFSRSVRDFLNTIDFLNRHEANFICPAYDLDTTTPMGKAMSIILVALAQLERELTVERIKNNNRSRAMRGLLNGGAPIFGYDKSTTESGRYIVNKEESPIVKQIYKDFLFGKKMHEIIEDLNERGIKNKTWIKKNGEIKGGESFSYHSLYTLLTNIHYTGRREVNKENKGKVVDEIKSEEKYMIIPAMWDAIIPPETFDKVQEAINFNKKVVKQAPNHDFLLSGILFCGECGKTLMGNSGTGRSGEKHFYYSHGYKRNVTCKVKSYSAIDIETRIKKEFFKFVKDPEKILAFQKIIKDLTKTDENVFKLDEKRFEKEIKELEERKGNLLRVMSLNPDSKEIKSMLNEVSRLEKQILLLTEKQEELKDNLFNEMNSRQIDPDYILAKLQSFCSESFRKKSLGLKRNLIRSVIKSVHIFPDESKIQVDLWFKEPTKIDEKIRHLQGKTDNIIPFPNSGRAHSSLTSSLKCPELQALVNGSVRVGVSGPTGT